MRSLDEHLYPEKLKVIAQQVQEHQAQTQTLLRLQQQEQLERENTPARSAQVRHAVRQPYLHVHPSVSFFSGIQYGCIVYWHA